MQVNPSSCCSRIVCRSGCLRQSRNDTQRHLCACAVQDGLIQCITDATTDLCQDVVSQVDIGVFQHCVAFFDVTAYLVAIDLDVIEADRQLVQVCTHLCPNCFSKTAVDYHSALARNSPIVNVLQQFGGFFCDLSQIRKSHIRDQYNLVCDISGLHDASDLSNKFLHVVSLDKCFSFLYSHQGERCSVCHGVHHSSLHDLNVVFSLFFFLFRLSWFRSDSLSALFFFQLLLEPFDLSFQRALLFIQLSLISFVLVNRFFDCGPFFLGLSLFDGCCQFDFSFLQFGLFDCQLIHSLASFIELLPKHQCSDCH